MVAGSHSPARTWIARTFTAVEDIRDISLGIPLVLSAAFLKSILTMLRRNDVIIGAIYSRVRYLWNLGTSEAVDGLREVYDRGSLREEPRLWLTLCEVLTAQGDGRGLADAAKILVHLERPTEPPAEEEPHRKWQSDRETRRSEAEAVIRQASKERLAEFVLHKAETTSPEQWRVVLQLLWKLPELPQPCRAILQQWAQDPDRQVATQARRLLDRD